MNSEIISEAATQMANLPYNLQKRALNYIKGLTLSDKNGVPGRNLLQYAGFIPPDDLNIMKDVIENHCRKVDANEW